LSTNQQAKMVLGNLARAVTTLQESAEFSRLMPEVRVNLVYALPDARAGSDVAAIDGRITVVRGFPHASGLPTWGGSDHMARLIIEVRKYDPGINAGINFKCDADIIEVMKQYCAEKKFLFGWIDRTSEPAEVMARDRSSMPWKIKQLVDSSGGVPKLFYEGDGWGKEPLSVVLGDTAVEVVGIAIDIAKRYKQKLG
jgi:predicted fused transcriptional regulator/phosphomethylpyrimidine kinase